MKSLKKTQSHSSWKEVVVLMLAILRISRLRNRIQAHLNSINQIMMLSILMLIQLLEGPIIKEARIYSAPKIKGGLLYLVKVLLRTLKFNKIKIRSHQIKPQLNEILPLIFQKFSNFKTITWHRCTEVDQQLRCLNHQSKEAWEVQDKVWVELPRYRKCQNIQASKQAREVVFKTKWFLKVKVSKLLNL
jgi:hypothetical protein